MSDKNKGNKPRASNARDFLKRGSDSLDNTARYSSTGDELEGREIDASELSDSIENQVRESFNKTKNNTKKATSFAKNRVNKKFNPIYGAKKNLQKKIGGKIGGLASKGAKAFGKVAGKAAAAVGKALMSAIAALLPILKSILLVVGLGILLLYMVTFFAAFMNDMESSRFNEASYSHYQLADTNKLMDSHLASNGNIFFNPHSQRYELAKGEQPTEANKLYYLYYAVMAAQSRWFVNFEMNDNAISFAENDAGELLLYDHVSGDIENTVTDEVSQGDHVIVDSDGERINYFEPIPVDEDKQQYTLDGYMFNQNVLSNIGIEKINQDDPPTVDNLFNEQAVDYIETLSMDVNMLYLLDSGLHGTMLGTGKDQHFFAEQFVKPVYHDDDYNYKELTGQVKMTDREQELYAAEAHGYSDNGIYEERFLERYGEWYSLIEDQNESRGGISRADELGGVSGLDDSGNDNSDNSDDSDETEELDETDEIDEEDEAENSDNTEETEDSDDNSTETEGDVRVGQYTGHPDLNASQKRDEKSTGEIVARSRVYNADYTPTFVNNLYEIARGNEGIVYPVWEQGDFAYTESMTSFIENPQLYMFSTGNSIFDEGSRYTAYDRITPDEARSIANGQDIDYDEELTNTNLNRFNPNSDEGQSKTYSSLAQVFVDEGQQHNFGTYVPDRDVMTQWSIDHNYNPAFSAAIITSQSLNGTRAFLGSKYNFLDDRNVFNENFAIGEVEGRHTVDEEAEKEIEDGFKDLFRDRLGNWSAAIKGVEFGLDVSEGSAVTTDRVEHLVGQAILMEVEKNNIEYSEVESDLDAMFDGDKEALSRLVEAVSLSTINSNVSYGSSIREEDGKYVSDMTGSDLVDWYVDNRSRSTLSTDSKRYLAENVDKTLVRPQTVYGGVEVVAGFIGDDSVPNKDKATQSIVSLALDSYGEEDNHGGDYDEELGRDEESEEDIETDPDLLDANDRLRSYGSEYYNVTSGISTMEEGLEHLYSYIEDGNEGDDSSTLTFTRSLAKDKFNMSKPDYNLFLDTYKGFGGRLNDNGEPIIEIDSGDIEVFTYSGSNPEDENGLGNIFIDTEVSVATLDDEFQKSFTADLLVNYGDGVELDDDGNPEGDPFRRDENGRIQTRPGVWDYGFGTIFKIAKLDLTAYELEINEHGEYMVQRDGIFSSNVATDQGYQIIGVTTPFGTIDFSENIAKDHAKIEHLLEQMHPNRVMDFFGKGRGMPLTEAQEEFLLKHTADKLYIRTDDVDEDGSPILDEVVPDSGNVMVTTYPVVDSEAEFADVRGGSYIYDYISNYETYIPSVVESNLDVVERWRSMNDSNAGTQHAINQIMDIFNKSIMDGEGGSSSSANFDASAFEDGQVEDLGFLTAEQKANANAIYSFLIDQGFGYHAAIGLLANANLESSFIPSATTGATMGFWQWLGPRRTQLQNFAAQNGTTESDPQIQLEFLMEEARTNTKYQELFQRMADADNSVDAARMFYNVWEMNVGMEHIMAEDLNAVVNSPYNLEQGRSVREDSKIHGALAKLVGANESRDKPDKAKLAANSGGTVSSTTNRTKPRTERRGSNTGGSSGVSTEPRYPFEHDNPTSTITSQFAMRVHPVHGGLKMHYGTDFGLESGAPILAVMSGEVLESGFNATAGYYVALQHDGDEFVSRYFHFREPPMVSAGDKVKQGQQLGIQGTTGTSTGDHLHLEIGFGVWRNSPGGDNIDPMEYLEGAISGSLTDAGSDGDGNRTIWGDGTGFNNLIKKLGSNIWDWVGSVFRSGEVGFDPTMFSEEYITNTKTLYNSDGEVSHRKNSLIVGGAHAYDWTHYSNHLSVEKVEMLYTQILALLEGREARPVYYDEIYENFNHYERNRMFEEYYKEIMSGLYSETNTSNNIADAMLSRMSAFNKDPLGETSENRIVKVPTDDDPRITFMSEEPNQEIHALKAGRVVYARRNSVIIRANDTNDLLAYTGLGSVDVSKGDEVLESTVIGTSNEQGEFSVVGYKHTTDISGGIPDGYSDAYSLEEQFGINREEAESAISDKGYYALNQNVQEETTEEDSDEDTDEE